MKIALLFPQPVYNSAEGGSRTLKKLALLFADHGNVSAVFSLGPKDTVVKNGNYVEYISRSYLYFNDGRKLTNFLDYITLVLFKNMISYTLMNKNTRMLRKLAKFKPDIIIALGQHFNNLTKRYKATVDQGVKVITSTDDVRGIEMSMASLVCNYKSNGGITGQLLALISSAVANGYLTHARKLYSECIADYDAITYVSKEDLNAATKRHKKYTGKMFVIPPPKDIEHYRFNVNKNASTVLFIGNCIGNRASMVARERIIKEIAPHVSDIKFILTGRGCAKFSKDNINSLGFIGNIDHIVENSDICIAPLEVGSGLKTKVLTYFSAGKPVIGTSIAFEGFPIEKGVNCIVENNISRYPNRIIELMHDYKARLKLSKEALKVADYFSPENVFRKWNNLFKMLGSGDTNHLHN